MPILDFSDLPSRGKETPRKSLKMVLGISLVFGVYTFGTTFASNISINSGGKVEYGQGLAITASCSDSTSLTVTPSSSFVNETGTGTFKFTTVTVADIPPSCSAKQFSLSAYKEDGTSINLFDGKKTLVVAGDGTTINTKFDVAGVSVKGGFDAQGVGAFTATFTTTPASADIVKTLTLESAEREFKPQYFKGDKGPGGGTVYWVDKVGFSAPGAPCGTSCNYLEFAPKTWYNGTSDPQFKWASDTSNFGVDDRLEYPYSACSCSGPGNIGRGFTATKNMMTSNAVTGYTADTSQAGYAASQYAGPTGTTLGQWHLPSLYELYRLVNYSFEQPSKVGLTGTTGGAGKRTYWSSTETTAVNASWIDTGNGGRDSYGIAKSGLNYVRPVRVY